MVEFTIPEHCATGEAKRIAANVVAAQPKAEGPALLNGVGFLELYGQLGTHSAYKLHDALACERHINS